MVAAVLRTRLAVFPGLREARLTGRLLAPADSGDGGDHDGHDEGSDDGGTHVVKGDVDEVVLMKFDVDGRRVDF